MATVALWKGAVMGGGVGLSINAMHWVCTKSTVFAMPESKIGLFCDVGVHYHLNRLPRQLKNALMICSEQLKGSQVYLSGLANYFSDQKFYESIID